MNIIFTILGLSDLVAVAMLFFPFSESLILLMMVYMLFKGGFFLLSNIASGAFHPLFLLMCFTDVLTGIALGAIVLQYDTIGVVTTFISAIRLLGLGKGLYSTITPLLG